MKPVRTALIVPVPEAENAVGPFRAALDTAASCGVPAHVTVLYPFLPPERVDETVLAAVGSAVAGVRRFAMTLTHVGWFAETVAWLAPRPDEPFRELTAAVWRRFPETPPYEGAYTDSVPHLTIGHDVPHGVLLEAASKVSAHLPIRAEVGAVRLMQGSAEPVSRSTVTEFPLG